MVQVCCVVGCPNKGGRKATKARMFSIPSVITHQGDEMRQITLRRRMRWLKNINRADMVEMTPSTRTSHRVCAQHFISGAPSYVMKQEDPDWAPTQNMGHNRIKVDSPYKAQAKKERHERLIRRKTRPAPCEIIKPQIAVGDVDPLEITRNNTPIPSPESSQTDEDDLVNMDIEELRFHLRESRKQTSKQVRLKEFKKQISEQAASLVEKDKKIEELTIQLKASNQRRDELRVEVATLKSRSLNFKFNPALFFS